MINEGSGLLYFTLQEHHVVVRKFSIFHPTKYAFKSKFWHNLLVFFPCVFRVLEWCNVLFNIPHNFAPFLSFCHVFVNRKYRTARQKSQQHVTTRFQYLVNVLQRLPVNKFPIYLAISSRLDEIPLIWHPVEAVKRKNVVELSFEIAAKLLRANIKLAEAHLAVFALSSREGNHLLRNIRRDDLPEVPRNSRQKQMQGDIPVSATDVQNFALHFRVPFHEPKIIVQDVEGVCPLQLVTLGIQSDLLHSHSKCTLAISLPATFSKSTSYVVHETWREGHLHATAESLYFSGQRSSNFVLLRVPSPIFSFSPLKQR